MTGFTPQKTCVKIEFGTLVSILLSPHVRIIVSMTRSGWVIKTKPGGAKMSELQPYPLCKTLCSCGSEGITYKGLQYKYLRHISI